MRPELRAQLIELAHLPLWYEAVFLQLRRVAAPVEAAAAARQLTRRVMRLPVLCSIGHGESVRTRKRRHVCLQRRSRRDTIRQPQQHLVAASSQVCPYGEHRQARGKVSDPGIGAVPFFTPGRSDK